MGRGDELVTQGLAARQKSDSLKQRWCVLAALPCHFARRWERGVLVGRDHLSVERRDHRRERLCSGSPQMSPAAERLVAQPYFWGGDSLGASDRRDSSHCPLRIPRLIGSRKKQFLPH